MFVFDLFLVWLATQHHRKLVSDHTAVPFLPVNPSFSSTRNQVYWKIYNQNLISFWGVHFGKIYLLGYLSIVDYKTLFYVQAKLYLIQKDVLGVSMWSLKMRAKLAKNDVCVAGFRFTEHFVQDFTMLLVQIFWRLFCLTCVTLVFVASICKKKNDTSTHPRHIVAI